MLHICNMRSTVILFSIAILISIVVVAYAWVGVDATYFLPLSKEIARGHTPYADFYCMYTPLALYYWAALYVWMPMAGHSLLLAMQVGVVAAAAFLLYRVGRACVVGSSGTWLPWVSLLFFVSILVSDGHYIMLEPFVVCCILWATWAMLRTDRSGPWLCGLAIGLAFFCKQFGLAAIVPVLLYYAGQRRYMAAGICLLSLGLTLAAGVLFFVLQGVGLVALMQQWYPAAYAGMDASAHFGWRTFVDGGKVLWLLLLFLLLTTRAIPGHPLRLYALSGFFIFLIPAFFRHFPHYFLLSMPYVFLLLLSRQPAAHGYTRWVPAFQLCLLLGLLAGRYSRHWQAYSAQQATAALLRHKVPHGSSVFATGHTYVLVINDYTNPLLHTLGYRWMRRNEAVKAKLPPGSILLPVQQGATDSVLLANGEVMRWYRKP